MQKEVQKQHGLSFRRHDIISCALERSFKMQGADNTPRKSINQELCQAFEANDASEICPPE